MLNPSIVHEIIIFGCALPFVFDAVAYSSVSRPVSVNTKIEMNVSHPLTLPLQYCFFFYQRNIYFSSQCLHDWIFNLVGLSSCLSQTFELLLYQWHIWFNFEWSQHYKWAMDISLNKWKEFWKSKSCLLADLDCGLSTVCQASPVQEQVNLCVLGFDKGCTL